MDCIYIALLSKPLYNITRNSPNHADIHTPPAESTIQGDSQLVRSSQGEVPCSGTPRHSRRSPGIELATLQLPANPLYPLSYCLPARPCSGFLAGSGPGIQALHRSSSPFQVLSVWKSSDSALRLQLVDKDELSWDQRSM